MSKKRKVIAIVIFGWIATTALCFGIFWLDFADVFGFHKREMLDYYQDDCNYYRASGRITEVSPLKDDGCHFRIEDFNPEGNITNPYYGSFSIHYPGAQELWDVWVPEEGITIEFVSADRIFFDGWNPPIVEIIHQETKVLDFASGKEKLLEWIRS